MTLLERRDRVQEIVRNPGSGDFDLLGAVDHSYITFSAALPSIDGDFVPYCARHRSSGQWEVGVGLFDDATNTLTRYDVLRTSTGGTSAIDFNPGIVDVWIDYAAEKSVMLDADSDNLTLPAAVTAVGAITAGASSVVTAGADADTDLRVGSPGTTPTAARVASVTINAPDSGSFRGSARAVFKRAASIIWSVGVFASVAGAMGAVTDFAFDPGTGTPVAAVSAAGALKLSSNIDVGGTTRLGGITYTWPGSQSAGRILSTDGAGALSWISPLEHIALTNLSDVTITSQATGDLFYAASASSWVNLAKGSNANVVLGQSGGIPAWTAAPTVSSGTDSSTLITFGTGGAAPSSSRSVSMVLNAPHSISNPGAAYLSLTRDSAFVWSSVGIVSTVAGSVAAITDYAWKNAAGTNVAGLSQTGALTIAAGLTATNAALSGATPLTFGAAGSISYDASALGITYGTSTDLPHRWVINGTPRWRMQFTSGALLGDQTANFIGVNTVDGADTGALTLCAASEGSTSRSGSISLYGNESAAGGGTYAADVHIFPGAGGQVYIGSVIAGVATDAAWSATDGTFNVYSKLIVGTDPTGSDVLRVGGNGTLSAGTDASTTLSVGTGGATPAASRTAKLILNTPDSGSFRGLAYVETQRNSVATWRAGLFAAVAGTMGAISDYGWAPGNTTPVASLTSAGTLTVAANFVTAGGKLLLGAAPATSAAINIDSATYGDALMSFKDIPNSVTITMAQRSDGNGVTFTNTTNGVTLSLFRNQIAGATTTAALNYEALTSTGASWSSAYAVANVLDDTNGSMDSEWYVQTYVAGAVTTPLRLQPDPSTIARFYRPGVGSLNANYEAIEVRYDTTTARVFSSASGTGTARELQIGMSSAPWGFTSTALYPTGTDNTLNLGTTSARIATAYVGTRLVIGNTTSNAGLIWVRTAGGVNAFTISDSTGVSTFGADMNVSAGTDASTTATFGSGGASPASARTVSIVLNTPDSGSFRGAAVLAFQRAGTEIWDIRVPASATGTDGAVTDLSFRPNGNAVMSLTTAGALKIAAGFTATSGTFSTTLGVTGAATFSTTVAVSSTSSTQFSMTRTGSTGVFMGLNDSGGNAVFIGNTNGVFSVQTADSGFSDKLSITAAGAATFASSLAITGALTGVTTGAFSGVITASSDVNVGGRVNVTRTAGGLTAQFISSHVSTGVYTSWVATAADRGYIGTGDQVFASSVNNFAIGAASAAGALLLGTTAGVGLTFTAATVNAVFAGTLGVTGLLTASAGISVVGVSSVLTFGVATSTIGFYGVTAIARAVLATGAGATVDNVITALQNLGLVKQS